MTAARQRPHPLTPLSPYWPHPQRGLQMKFQCPAWMDSLALPLNNI